MESGATEELALRFSHNIVEHLGLKLYQNQPTRVIAEIISNGWDADAERVAVSIDESGKWISVKDDGVGMSRDTLANSFLVVGHPKRSHAAETSPSGRSFMGRKGIGKLAPFGIAKTVDVVTANANADGVVAVHWLRFDLRGMLAQGDGEVVYKPTMVADGVAPSDLPLKEDTFGEVSEFSRFVAASKGVGTLVLMSDLSLSRSIPAGQLIASLGSRFTVATEGRMIIEVNGVQVGIDNALPAFEFRIPESGKITENVGGREVSYWVGFVERADWPQDQAGVGVYAHGKIAQDRPFTFGVRGKEIFARYMLGFVEANWLDEFEGDLISTDRTSVNWDTEETRELYRWGTERTREWLGRFERWRQENVHAENRELVAEALREGRAPQVTSAEEEEIVRLVSEVTPRLGKDSEARDRLIKAVSDAWVQKPMRELVKDLWSSLGHQEEAPHVFTSVVERLSSHSVPESLNLAAIFAQRAFALARLHEYVHHGREVDLQRLIERFPWIIEPDLAVLTANRSLKTAITRAEAAGQIPTGHRLATVPEQNRPDFVFLSSPEQRQIVIVELKNPQEDLTIDNRSQLIDYMTWFEAHYPNADLTGYLVGRNSANLASRHEGVSIVPWTEILLRSRARNLELLAAMMLQAGGDSSQDARLIDAVELGGEDARVLLDKIAESNQSLRDLMSEFESLPVRRQSDDRADA